MRLRSVWRRSRQASGRAADIQFIIPVHASLAELALWQGKPDEAVAH